MACRMVFLVVAAGLMASPAAAVRTIETAESVGVVVRVNAGESLVLQTPDTSLNIGTLPQEISNAVAAASAAQEQVN